MQLYRAHVLVCGGTGCTSSNSNKIITELEEQIARIFMCKIIQSY